VGSDHAVAIPHIGASCDLFTSLTQIPQRVKRGATWESIAGVGQFDPSSTPQMGTV